MDDFGVENKMFFGMREICALVFRNKVRLDLLRRWVHYADFPAPYLPKTSKKAERGMYRVTTWGLVESWLMVLYEADFPESGIARLANDVSGSARQRARVAGTMKKLNRGREKEVEDAVRKISKRAELRINREVERRVAVFRRKLEAELYEETGQSEEDEKVSKSRVKRRQRVD